MRALLPPWARRQLARLPDWRWIGASPAVQASASAEAKQRISPVQAMKAAFRITPHSRQRADGGAVRVVYQQRFKVPLKADQLFPCRQLMSANRVGRISVSNGDSTVAANLSRTGR